MQWNDLEDQACSVSRTVSVIGDRWTILILRDCFLRVRRFDDFQSRLGMGRPILADRLNKLVEAAVLKKVVYQTNPTRYEYRLTPRGLDLYPIVMSIVHWGDIHMSDKKGRPLVHHHKTCGHQFDPVMICSECHEVLDPHEVQPLPGPGARQVQHLPIDIAEEARQSLTPRKPSARATKARAGAGTGTISKPKKKLSA